MNLPLIDSRVNFSQIASAWHSMRGRFVRRRGEVWSDDVRGVIAALSDVNRSTEKDFLALGEQLRLLMAGIRQIHRDVTVLADLISGEQSEQACLALTQTLEHIARVQERTEAGAARLSEVLSGVRAIRAEFAGFDAVALSFQVIATLANIETARLQRQDTGLTDFADEISGYGRRLHTCVDEVLSAISSIEGRSAPLIQNIVEALARQTTAATELRTSVDDDLLAYTAQRREAADASTRLAAEFASITGDVSNIVASIQIQDITRQRIEHVIEGLSGALVQQGKGSPTATQGLVLQLNDAQLVSASAAFVASVEQIESALNGIADRIETIASDSAHSVGASDHEQTSFFTTMETSFGTILKTLSDSETLNSRIASASAELGAMIAELGKSLGQVQDIAVDIRHLSLNSRIRAIHLGPCAEPLNVIAEAMQALESDCESRSDASQSRVCRIQNAVSSVCSEMQPQKDGSVISELRASLESLRTAAGSTSGRVAEIGKLAGSLGKDARAVQAHCSVRERLAATVSDCCATLRRLQPACSTAEQEVPSVAMGHLDVFASRYTMASERDIHASVAAGSGAIAVTEPPPMAAADDGLGDNVELF